MDSDRVRQAAVVAATTVGIAVGLAGDYGSANASGSTIIPANYAFGIWAPIYAGSLAYAFHQARPGRRTDPLLRRIGWPSAIAYLTVGLWVHADSLWVYEGLIATSLAAAAVAYGRLGARTPSTDASETWLVRVPLGLFTGWVTLAAAAGTTEGLLERGVRELGLGAEPWGVLVLLAAGAVATAVTVRIPATSAYPAAVTWGLVASAIQHLPTTPATGATAGAMAALVAATGAWRARGGDRRGPAPRRARARAGAAPA